VKKGFVYRLGVAAVLAVCSACGGAASPLAATQAAGLLAAGTPTPAPSPSPATPAPVVAPTPTPTPTPCTQGLCEEPTTNTNPPVRLTLRIYTVVNGAGQQISGITEESAIPLGLTVTVDATAKDEGNKDTLGQSVILWEFENADRATVGGNHTHQRRITGNHTGTVLVRAVQGGVISNTVTLKFD
jgi:hypothetical protein